MTANHNSASTQSRQNPPHSLQCQLLRREVYEYVSYMMHRNELVNKVFLVVVEIIYKPFDVHAFDQGRIDACCFDQ